jgi:hypothetical protein
VGGELGLVFGGGGGFTGGVDLLQILEMLSYVVTIIALPLAILTFMLEERKEWPPAWSHLQQAAATAEEGSRRRDVCCLDHSRRYRREYQESKSTPFARFSYSF